MNELSGHTELVDPRDELAELASATLALVEWYSDAGAFGLPVEESSEAALLSIQAGSLREPSTQAGSLREPSTQAGSLREPSTQAGSLREPSTQAGSLREPSTQAGSLREPSTAGAASAPRSASGPRAPSRPIVGAQPHESPPRLAASAFGSAALPGTRAVRSVSAPPEQRPPYVAQRSEAESSTPAISLPVEPTGGSALSSEERRTRLALLAEDARACTRCGLHEQRKQAVFARGNPFAELCFVGEGPGADEDAVGEPFVGAAGQLLDKMISAMGYRRPEVYICNIVKCRPPKNRKPEPEEVASCSPFVTAQLELIRPKVIVALGATAVQGLIGTSEGITRMRGKWKLYKGTTPIMPTFHPAYLLRTPEAKREVWADLQEVMRHLGKAAAPRG